MVQTQQFKQLTNAGMEGVEAGRRDPEFLALAAQLLQNNPDVYTVWNHRRIALQEVLKAIFVSVLQMNAASAANVSLFST